MAANSPEPSSSKTEEEEHVPEEVLSGEVQNFCDVNYVNDAEALEFQGDNYEGHLRPDDSLPVAVSYSQYIEACTSSETYAQVSLPSYSTVSRVTASDQSEFHCEAENGDNPPDEEHFLGEDKRINIQALPVSQILQSQSDADNTPPESVLGLHEDSVDSHHSQVQEPNDTLQPVTLSVDHLNLSHVSIVHSGLSNISSIPIILDRNSIAALLSSSRSDGSFTLDVSNLPRGLLASSSQAERPSSEEFISSDQGMLPPMLSQKDILTSMMASTSASTSTSSSFPINHKQMLAQKYAAEMLGSTSSASLISDQQLIESMSSTSSASYVVPSGSGAMIDSNHMAYEDQTASLASTSSSQCLPLDVYAIDRGVSLVTSSRDAAESAMNQEEVEFENGSSHTSSHHSVQNYVSSSVDLVQSHRLDPTMQCAVDSTVGPKLHHGDENIVDSSDGYSHHLEGSSRGLHTTSREYRQISEMNSCDGNATNEVVTSVLSSGSSLDANEALSSSSHHFSHSQMDELQGCSSSTLPDSTRSPIGMSENSPSYSLTHSAIPDPAEAMHEEYSRPRREPRSNRHWCEDCGTFYDRECTQHRIQLIFDKPVLSRAWASLPAQYLYVNKVGNDDEDSLVYGVFAKKTIPKRTQFGPVEGVLVKREDPPSDNFIFLVEHENNIPLYLDTTDESMSNWMRFVRPADTHKEQNLVLVQQGQSLFFNTTRAINPKSELRVWYSGAYAEKWGLPLLEPDDEERRALQEQENAWPCFECNQRFTTSIDLQRHLNQHDEENEAAGSPRSRARLRARSKFAKRLQASRLRATVENGPDGVEILLVRKPRGRPQKKYKLPLKQEEHTCEICQKVFPRNYSLQRHLIMHSGEKKYKCPICDIKFSHVYNRNRHVRRHKRDNNLQAFKPIKSLFKKRLGAEWVCTHCGLTFLNSNVLNLHTLTHAAEDVAFHERHPFLGVTLGGEERFDNSDSSKMESDVADKCPECGEEFFSRRDLIEHASVHGKQRCIRGIINPLKPFKCNLCYKSFASDERLIRHYLVHGSEDSKPLQCEICYKRFLNNSALACHIKVHSEERKLYECPICKAEFSQIVALKEHVHVHCDDGVYHCPSCHKVFEEYNQVRKHIRAFHSERRYPCEKCDKIFPRPDKLKLHMLRHSDHREFLCANCGKQFKRKDKLKEHMKRMHAPDREAKANAKCNKSPSSKKFVPKVSPTDYHRFIYKCHSCLLGFKRRGMLVNHLAKRHPDIRPESVPELNLPILKTTRDYYCQYCEKVYKSSSKRKAHILKNHPGHELPMSNRRKGGVPEIPGLPNPTFSQTVGSITTHPHYCSWCHKQYASKAKLLQHQRKKHLDMLAALTYVAANSTKVEPVCDQGTQVTGQIVIENIASLGQEATAVLIDATKRKIHYVDKDALIVSTHADGLPTADLLTQAMSELTQNLAEYRAGEILAARLQSASGGLVDSSPTNSPPSSPPPSTSPSVLDTAIAGPLDQIQLNQLLAQYQQQQLSPQQLAVVVTSVSRSWPTSSLSNYPAR